MVTAPTISIPQIGVHAKIMRNVDAASLSAGAGHYPGTGWPGQGRTVGLAGHDVTVVRAAQGDHVFGRLAALHLQGRSVIGDRVVVFWHRQRHLYRITRQEIVPPTRVSVLRDRGYEQIVTTTCYPPHSATYRLVTYMRAVVSIRPGNR